MEIRVAIFEDNKLVRDALAAILNGTNGYNCCGTFTDGGQWDIHIQVSRPDVVLMDIEMPLMNGIEATANVTQNTDIKVLILTVFDNDEKIFDAIKAGAAGYLLKDSKPYRIINAIEDIMQGGGPMSPQIAAKALALLREKTTDSKKPQPADYNLSDRETQLLQSLVEGLSYQQIADKLFISHGTVRKHIENIYSKLHIHTKVEAVQTANKHKWFS